MGLEEGDFGWWSLKGGEEGKWNIGGFGWGGNLLILW